MLQWLRSIRELIAFLMTYEELDREHRPHKAPEQTKGLK